MKEKFFPEPVANTILKSIEELGQMNKKIEQLINILLFNGISVNILCHIFPTKDQKELTYNILMAFFKENCFDEDVKDVVFRELVNLKYRKTDVCELILAEIDTIIERDLPKTCWNLCDYLYILCQKDFKDDYIRIARHKKLGIDRQMLFLLMGKLKEDCYLPVIIENLNDETVNGHALSALSKYHLNTYDDMFVPFLNDKRPWVRKIAKKKLNIK